jgi:hypothetical protein
MESWRLGIVVLVFGVLGATAPACSREPRRAPVETVTEWPPAPARAQEQPTVAPGGARSTGGPRVAAALDPVSVGVLKQAIESKDYATRLIAIEAVGDAQAEGLVGWLEQALGDPEHDVRMAAIEALGRIHSARALGLLATVRDDATEELDIRAVAAGVLIRTTP